MPASVIGNSDWGGYEYARSKNRGNGFWNQFLRWFNLDNALEERERRIHSRWLEATVKAVTADILSQSHWLQEDIVWRVVRVVISSLELSVDNPLIPHLLEFWIDFPIDLSDSQMWDNPEVMDILNACEDEFWISIPNLDREADTKLIITTIEILLDLVHRKISEKIPTAPSPR